jgi:metal-sulfur cluster biosynthetic enzyme
VTATAATIEAILDEIMDPCSISAKAPMSIVEMGLVRAIEIDGGAVHVRLRFTSPGCLMGLTVFWPEITRRVSELPGVESVAIEIEDSLWSEDDIRPEARERLEAVRRARSDRRNRALPVI